MSEEGIQKSIEESDDKTYKRPVGTIFPTFFIGVGGCGSSIVNNIKQFVQARPDYEERYKDLVQFMAFDTDQDDLKSLEGIEGYLISDFPKGEYVRLQTGKEYIDADPFFTQWWPDWYASRPDSTKGAGQIRVESRLSLYYQFDQDKSGIIGSINDKILKSKDHNNPYRAVRPPAAYVYIFCSVAGGTGSGGILTLGYLMKELLKAQRLMPVVVGNLVLPTLFYRKVRTRLHDDIKSNGYAALKELEWFMTLGYNNNPRMLRGDCVRAEDDKIEFNFNPLNKPDAGNTSVNMPPFDLINVIDQPGDFSFAKPQDIYPAIAGAAYVQLFSPIMGQRESEEDNYYKKIKHLENGFSRNWGTFGLSMLVLPDKQIHEYCAYQLGLVLTEKLGGKESTADTFKQVSEAAKKEFEAGKSNPTSLPGKPNMRILYDAGLLGRVFTTDEDRAVLKAAYGDDPWNYGAYQRIEKLRDGVLAQMKKKIGVVNATWDPEIDESPPEDFTTFMEKLNNKLRTEFKGRLSSFASSATSAVTEPLADGLKALGDPEPDKSNRRYEPVGVRLAIGMMNDELEDVSAPADLADNAARVELPAETVSSLQEKAKVQVTERFGEDDWVYAGDDAASGAETVAVAQVTNAETWAANYLKAQLSEQLTSSLSKAGALGELSGNLKAALEKGAKKVLEDAKSGKSREFVLDAEVLQGLRTRTRYWDNLWRWIVEEKGGSEMGCRVGSEGKIEADTQALLAVKERVEKALLALESKAASKNASRGGGKAEVPPEEQEKQAAKVILQECRKRLVDPILGKRQAGDNRAEKGLLMDDCLWLEAKWELEELFIQDHLVNYGDTLSDADKDDRGRKLAAKNEPLQSDMEEYINEKIRFICEKSRVLARLRLTESSAVDPFIFVALSSHYEDPSQVDVGEDSSTGLTDLWKIVKNAHPMLKASRKLDDWVDEKRIAFYQGQAGLPVHNFWPVNGELLESYERVYRNYVSGSDPNAKPKADFPSHIDKAFEDPEEWNPHAVLPSLQPDRTVAGGGSGEQAFYQLLSHDLIQEVNINLPGDVAEGDRDKRIDDIVAAILKQVTGADAGGLQGLRLKQTVEEALGRDRGELNPPRGKDDKVLPLKWYVLHVPEPQAEPGVSSILQNSLPSFVIALGSRIDKAFDTYQQDFRRGNRRLAAQLDAVLHQRTDKVNAAEDPTTYRDTLEKLDKKLKTLQGEYMLLAEQGHRVDGFLRFIEGALMQVRGLYTNFQAGGEK